MLILKLEPLTSQHYQHWDQKARLFQKKFHKSPDKAFLIEHNHHYFHRFQQHFANHRMMCQSS